MTDKKTRKEILEFLRSMNEQDTDFPVEDKEIANEMGMDLNVVRATLKYLSEKNLINLDQDNLTWFCSIHANGIDELDKLESENKTKTTTVTNSNMKKSPTVFVSHSINDLDIVKRIKSWLEYVGISVFIAHQDIEPAKDFDIEIIEQLKSSLIFVPLLTKNFKKSEWCDQEAGMAIATNSIILPIKIDNDPHGFMNKKNALRWNDDMPSITDLAKSILSYLSLEEQKRIRHELLKEGGTFSSCGSYDKAGLLSNIISDFSDLTITEMKIIAESVITNDQIYASRSARPNLVSIFKKNRDKIPQKLLTNDLLSSYL